MCRLARKSQPDPKRAVTSDFFADSQDVLFEIAMNLEPGFSRMDVSCSRVRWGRPASSRRIGSNAF